MMSSTWFTTWFTFGQSRSQSGNQNLSEEDRTAGLRTGLIPTVRDTCPLILSVLVALSLTLFSLPAKGQGPSPDALIRKGQQAGAEVGLMREVASRSAKAGRAPTDVSAILRLAVNAAQNDLPSRAILETALEGLSKEVPSGRLQAVVQQDYSRIEASGAFVESWMRKRGPSDRSRTQHFRLVESVAQARRHGLPFEEVQALWETVDDRASQSLLAAATTGASLLKENGLSAEQARSVVSASLKSGHSEAQLRTLVASVLSQSSQTVPLGVLARSGKRSVRKGLSGAGTRRNPVSGRLPGLGLEGGPPVNIASRMSLPSQDPDIPSDKDNPPGKGKPPR